MGGGRVVRQLEKPEKPDIPDEPGKSIPYSDELLLETAGIPVIEKMPDDLQWTDYFKAMHSYLAGTTPPRDSFRSLIVVFLTKSIDPFHTDDDAFFNIFTPAGARSVPYYFNPKHIRAAGKQLNGRLTGPTMHKRWLLDNKVFRDWYMKKENEKDAQRLFCLLCCIYMRAIVQDADSVFDELQYRFLDRLYQFRSLVRSPAFIRMDKTSVVEGAKIIKDFEAKGSAILHHLLVNFDRHMELYYCEKLKRFHEYAIETPFALHGLQLFDIVDKVLVFYEESIDKLGAFISKQQLSQPLIDLEEKIEPYIRVRKEFDEDSAKYKYNKYARIFVGGCYLKADLNDHIQLVHLLIGMLPDYDERLLNTIKGNRVGVGWFEAGRKIQMISNYQQLFHSPSCGWNLSYRR